MTLLEKIDDLIKQATTERSNYYTAGVLADAKAEIIRLRKIIEIATRIAEKADK